MVTMPDVPDVPDVPDRSIICPERGGAETLPSGGNILENPAQPAQAAPGAHSSEKLMCLDDPGSTVAASVEPVSASANASGATFPPLPTCLACSQSFTSRRAWQRFCSERCRRAFHNQSRAESVALRTALERIARIAAEALGQQRGPGGHGDGGGDGRAAGGRGDA